jgi:hypothetical protein
MQGVMRPKKSSAFSSGLKLSAARASTGQLLDARLAVFDFIEAWYKPHRRHSGLDYVSPMIFERSHSTGHCPAPSGSTTDFGGCYLSISSGEGIVMISKAVHRPPNRSNSTHLDVSEFCRLPKLEVKTCV